MSGLYAGVAFVEPHGENPVERCRTGARCDLAEVVEPGRPGLVEPNMRPGLGRPVAAQRDDAVALAEPRIGFRKAATRRPAESKARRRAGSSTGAPCPPQ